MVIDAVVNDASTVVEIDASEAPIVEDAAIEMDAAPTPPVDAAIQRPVKAPLPDPITRAADFSRDAFDP